MMNTISKIKQRRQKARDEETARVKQILDEIYENQISTTQQLAVVDGGDLDYYWDQEPATSQYIARWAGALLSVAVSGSVIVGVCCAFAVNYVRLASARAETQAPSSVVAEETADSETSEEITEPEPIVGVVSNREPLQEVIFEQSETVENVPQYTERDIKLTLYDQSTSCYTAVEPDDAGNYRLNPDGIYSVRCDISSLYEDKAINADITVSSDFLIEEGSTGTIDLELRDHNQNIICSDKLSVTSTAGNLGIEFCAKECTTCAYGREWLDICDGSIFLCFYTSGNYVESDSHHISSGGSMYKYECSMRGSKAQEAYVTEQPESTTALVCPPEVDYDSLVCPPDPNSDIHGREESTLPPGPQEPRDPWE